MHYAGCSSTKLVAYDLYDKKENVSVHVMLESKGIIQCISLAPLYDGLLHA